MIALLGDIHGDAYALADAERKAAAVGCVALIQVGDLGVYDGLTRENFAKVASQFTIPVYFIDGNHEDYRLMRGWAEKGEPAEWVPGLTWLPRGYVLEIDGVKIGCLGGAGSIDYNFRKAGKDWFPEEEQITDAQADALITQGPVDLLVTHTPPQSTIDAYFNPADKRMFGAPLEWFDPSAHQVERVWQALGRPDLYCGHMHRPVDSPSGVRILTIAELVQWAPILTVTDDMTE